MLSPKGSVKYHAAAYLRCLSVSATDAANKFDCVSAHMLSRSKLNASEICPPSEADGTRLCDDDVALACTCGLLCKYLENSANAAGPRPQKASETVTSASAMSDFSHLFRGNVVHKAPAKTSAHADATACLTSFILKVIPGGM